MNEKGLICLLSRDLLASWFLSLALSVTLRLFVAVFS